MIDLPKAYTNQIGYYADGFATASRFTEENFQQRLSSFKEKFKNPEPLLMTLLKNIAEEPKYHLSSSFKYISIGKTSLPDDLKFSFQYKYLFRKGHLSLVDLFKDPDFRKAVEVVFFAVLHEQSFSYPVGAAHELQKIDRFDFYQKAIIAGMQSNRFGLEYSDLSKKSITVAIQWVRARAISDPMRLKSLLN